MTARLLDEIKCIFFGEGLFCESQQLLFFSREDKEQASSNIILLLRHHLLHSYCTLNPASPITHEQQSKVQPDTITDHTVFGRRPFFLFQAFFFSLEFTDRPIRATYLRHRVTLPQNSPGIHCHSAFLFYIFHSTHPPSFPDSHCQATQSHSCSLPLNFP